MPIKLRFTYVLYFTLLCSAHDWETGSYARECSCVCNIVKEVAFLDVGGVMGV